MFDMNDPLSSLEQKIIDCLTQHGELQWEELASKLGSGMIELYDPIVWLMARDLLNCRTVDGIGKYPAISTKGLKFFLLEKAATDF